MDGLVGSKSAMLEVHLHENPQTIVSSFRAAIRDGMSRGAA